MTTLREIETSNSPCKVGEGCIDQSQGRSRLHPISTGHLVNFTDPRKAAIAPISYLRTNQTNLQGIADKYEIALKI